MRRSPRAGAPWYSGQPARLKGGAGGLSFKLGRGNECSYTERMAAGSRRQPVLRSAAL
jgi:hypothetical protein